MNRQTQLACLLYLAVALGSRPAAAEPNAKCPPGTAWAGEALGIKNGDKDGDLDDWLIACAAAPDGGTLLAALLLPKEPEESDGADDAKAPKPKARASQATLIVSHVTGAKKPQPVRFKLDAKRFNRWADPQLFIDAEKLGDVPILNIAYRTSTGEDYYSASETITLISRTGAGLVHVWTGEGGSMSRSMDLCYVRRTASFSLNGDGSLQRTVRSEYSLNKANYRSDLPVLRTIRKECRGAPSTSTKIPLAVRLR